MFKSAVSLLAIGVTAASGQLAMSAAQLAEQFSLTTSTSIPFPTQTLSNTDTQAHLLTNWSLSKGKIQDGESNVAFVANPYNTSSDGTSTPSSAPVFQVTYPKGQFASKAGAQFYSLWNLTGGESWGSMQLSYDVAFEKDFNWVKGGKLPGLRAEGGANGCSGGSEPDGTDCFSTRLMWRKDGKGEAYSYIPRPNDLCSGKDVTCNSDFGITFDRGSFTFVSGTWNRVTILIQLNNPPNIANGNMIVYYNNVHAFTRSNLQFRSRKELEVGGMYFSTFFGGSDESWATTRDEHTYYRNIQLWGSSAASTLPGAAVSAATRRSSSTNVFLVSLLAFVGATVVA